jgi:hypothetical protein
VNGGIKNSLTVKLTQVAALVASHRPAQAVNLLNAFVSQVNDLRSTGDLTAEQATVLTTSAAVIMTTIQH